MSAYRFFPVGVFGAGPRGYPELSPEVFYSRLLESMDEHPLYQAVTDAPFIIRLLIMASFREARLVRVWRAQSGWQMISKQSKWWNGPSALSDERPRELDSREGTQVEDGFAGVGFWSLQSADTLRYTDGWECLLEAADSARYHVVHRSNPEESAFLDFVRLLGRISQSSGA